MKMQMEMNSQHCWKFIYKHSDISIFAVCHRFYFFTCTGVGKIFLQINPAAVAFIDILIAAWEVLEKSHYVENMFGQKMERTGLPKYEIVLFICHSKSHVPT